MRKPIRLLVIAGTAGLVIAGGSTAAALAATNGSDGPGRPAVTADRGDRGDRGDRSDRGDDVHVADRDPEVDAARAERVALGRVPGGAVTELELEYEHGRLVWEVDVVDQRREHDVTIDATDGTVLDEHVDHEDHDGDDDPYDD